MKYLAILRDSFREALDSKILYVTWGLAALVLLFVASISIRPLTMERELQIRADVLQFLFRNNQGGQRDLVCEVQDFAQTNDAAEPWNGDYRFTFVLTQLGCDVVHHPEIHGAEDASNRQLLQLITRRNARIARIVA